MIRKDGCIKFLSLLLVLLMSVLMVKGDDAKSSNEKFSDSLELVNPTNFKEHGTKTLNFLEHKRNLASCTAYSDCSSCNAVDTCKWSATSCQDNPSGVKALEDYKLCQNDALQRQYCFPYSGQTPYELSTKVRTLKHYPDTSNKIPAGVICEWLISVTPSGTVSYEIDWTEKEAQEIFIEFTYSNDVINNINTTHIDHNRKEFKSESTKFIKIYAIQKRESSRSTYNVILYKYYEPQAQILLIIICLMVVVFLIVGVLMATKIIHSCIKLREARLELQNQQRIHDKRMNRILEENPPVPYEQAHVKFHQTSCVICLEEFEDDLGRKVRILPQCNHVFHSECINEWFKNSKDVDCPHCHNHLLTKKEIKRVSMHSRSETIGRHTNHSVQENDSEHEPNHEDIESPPKEEEEKDAEPADISTLKPPKTPLINTYLPTSSRPSDSLSQVQFFQTKCSPPHSAT
ncbi:unnamed protein product [Moneuplotes crassus]|uniref:RING-type domain-containing protein n=1 Tax=Euplotes crassus TaxID=5936 RepID=A0AAD1U8I3_EUPCR|nr:unnamed protein product [Moneuplotes crassus]